MSPRSRSLTKSLTVMLIVFALAAVGLAQDPSPERPGRSPATESQTTNDDETGPQEESGEDADETEPQEESGEDADETGPQQESGEDIDDTGPQEAGGDAEEEPTGDVPDSLTIDGTDIVALRDGNELWRLEFPEDSGGTGAVLLLPDVAWAGHGNSLLRIDPANGTVTERFPLPGRIIRLESAGDSISVVTDIDGALRQRIEVTSDGPVSTVRFGLVPELFQWTRREARVEDPRARLETDPTNPWLYLRAGLSLESSDPDRQELLSLAVDRALTFYDLAGIAQELEAAGEEDLAERAVDAALADFSRRGYDPRLLDDAEVHYLYDFPLEPFERALDEGDLESATFWAPWVYLTASDELPRATEALERFASQLEQVGRIDEAALWRQRAEADASPSPAATLERYFTSLARVGWYGAIALLVAIIALHLTLLAKYWLPQSLAIRQRVETGQPRRSWTRLFAIRYYSFTEKLVLVLLLAATLVMLALASWYDSARFDSPALASGSLASPVARDVVSSLPLQGERGAFIRGYAAHVSGEVALARQEYLAAGDYPPALNNLAALTGDDQLYSRALRLAPSQDEAAHNLGERSAAPPFHTRYRANQPLLAVPTEADFRAATAGSWQSAIASVFSNPWGSLRGVELPGLPSVAWQILLALFLLWAVVQVVWLVVPRPTFARNAPRTSAYHVLALLVPGSGLADEAWGLLLMVPWALLGVDVLSQQLGWGRSLGLPVSVELWALAGIYLINLLAFVVEFNSYRRRMRALRRTRPEAFEAYRLKSA